MNKKKLFRFEIVVESTLRVEEVKDTDYGKERYLKQLVKGFVKDPEALRSFILINFIDIYWAEPWEGLSPFLGNQDDSQAAILRLAKKCTPETFHYFSDLFAALQVKKMVPDAADEENLLDAGTFEKPGKDGEEKEKEWEKVREWEWIFGQLTDRLCKFAPVHVAFSEAPAKKKPTSPGMNRGV
jgi:hypothetical protein